MTSAQPEFVFPARAMIDAPGGDPFPHKHLLAIADLHPEEIRFLLQTANGYVTQSRQALKHSTVLGGLTQINLFFENSTRTLMSFEIAGRRLGMDTVSMTGESSSVRKGETLLDTAQTLNAMRPDVLVVRHGQSGAVALLAQKVDGAVINAGDGWHEHPTQALLDALTILRHKGRIEGLDVAICGDIAHSRVARSNLYLLSALGAYPRLVGPATLMPAEAERLGARVYTDLESGLKDADVVMMLRLQRERMDGAFVPSEREYFRFFGLTEERLACAKPDAMVMHPGPMNRGVEIATPVADLPDRSVIETQVEMGVAVRMACLDILTRQARQAQS